MADDFLNYYNDELTFLKQQGQYFAEQHPKTAGRLKLSPDAIDDPFVGRMMESFAFLTARIQQQLDSEYAFASDNLLDTIYPHFRLPIPAMAISQIDINDKLDRSYELKRDTAVISQLANQKICRFKTCYDIVLQPIKIDNVSFKLQMPGKLSQQYQTARANLHIELSGNKPSVALNKLDLTELVFYIDLASESATNLYSLLFHHCLGVSIDAKDQTPIHLNARSVQHVGFADTDAVLPQLENSASAYRLLTEYFCFPQKFLFFKLSDIGSIKQWQNCQNLEINILFDQSVDGLEKHINQHSLKLHCTPVINLFEREAEPIKVDYSQSSYQVVVDNQQPQADCEVYQITQMTAALEYGQPIDCLRMLGDTYHVNPDKQQLYWQLSRKPCWQLGLDKLAGSECFVETNTTDSLMQELPTIIMRPQVSCTNRELTNFLPYTGGHIRFQLWAGEHDAIQDIKSVSLMTRPQYRHLQHSGLDLINHLQVNQLGFRKPKQLLTNMKKLLAFYHYFQTDADKLIDAGLVDLRSERVLERHPNGLKIGFCQGIAYQLVIDEEMFVNHNVYLFALIIRQFLARFASINSFIKLSLYSKQRGELKSWPALIGYQENL